MPPAMAPRFRAPTNALAFKRRLLHWFRRHGRDLPWRRTRDPYRVIVSEFMLQQTQVSRVREYYHRFVSTFPTLESLARAPRRRVQASWRGLGYYRRAANLHALARTVVREHAGTVPSDRAALRALPGVGDYTAGAVASFAYERRTPAIDTNVERVLRRVFGPPGQARDRGGSAAQRRRLHDLAVAILPVRARTAWEFNQALMDLGAMICRARKAECGICPVRPACRTGRRRQSL